MVTRMVAPESWSWMADLVGGVGRVDRGDRAAGHRDAVEHHGVLGQVRRHQASVEPGPNPRAASPPAKRVDHVLQLTERVAPTAGHVA